MVLALVAAVSAAGCGGGDGNDDGGGEPAGAAPGVVEITDFKFMPAKIEVDAGSTIRWTNEDGASHTATAKGSGGFDTGTIRKGQTKAATVRRAGTIAYICDFHPFMKGRITVR